MIEILSTGALNSVQDLGRKGYLNIGVGQSGAMDRLALSTANIMVGNPTDFAGLEIVLFPARLKFITDSRFALTGADALAHLDGFELPPNWVCDGKAGQTLIIQAPRRGARVYLAFAGGIDVPVLLGSRATDLKSGFGGLEGRGLIRGDQLSLNLPRAKSTGSCGLTGVRELPSLTTATVIRVLPAAQYEDFEDEVRERFFSEPWQVTQEANRMGMRLSGSELKLCSPLELLSHGILPGTVQVPPSGQPIIQMAEANTCGGYPKIANVIDADLSLLAQAPVGSKLRFLEIDLAEAIEAQKQLDLELNSLERTLGLTL
ncbi:biotin-dependent carboxyltransferase family protein [Pseudomonas sp. LB3P38]|uniref:5-oxoprolinase subunit C family protein n=1 Tax=Pseudomonas lyxosi TaxID=3398358 RepID=UPI0039EF6C80